MKFLKLSQMNGLDKDSQKYDFQFISIRILALGHHLGFGPLGGLSAAILGHIFNNLPYKENDINLAKKPFFQTSKCYLLRCYLQRVNVTGIGSQYCRGNRVGRKLCCSGPDSGRHIY